MAASKTTKKRIDYIDLMKEGRGEPLPSYFWKGCVYQ
jgi:hypothetical protein